jgi:hypothetical protein
MALRNCSFDFAGSKALHQIFITGIDPSEKTRRSPKCIGERSAQVKPNAVAMRGDTNQNSSLSPYSISAILNRMFSLIVGEISE